MSRNWILGVLMAAASFGCATTQTPTLDSANKSVAVSAASLANQHCVQDTGSYIKRSDEKCANRPGISYSNQEIQDTGRLSTEDALRVLDPRIQ